MVKSKKITVALTVSLFLLIGFILLHLLLAGLVSERLKEPLSRKLSQWVNEEVEIGQLSTNIFNSLTINGLKIYPRGKRNEDPLFETSRINIKYKFWRLLFTRDFNRSITAMVLVDPKIHLRYRQGKWNLSELLAGPVSIGHQLPYSLLINNGQIISYDQTGRFDQIFIKKIQGSIRQKTKEQIVFRFKAATSLSHNDRVTLTGTYTIPQSTVSADLNGRKISLEKIPQLFSSPYLSKAQGEMSLSLAFRYDTLSRGKFTCNGTAVVKNSEFWLSEAQDLIRDFSSTLEFDEKNLYFRNTTFKLANSSYQLSGSVNDYPRQAIADLKLKSAAWDLADLSKLFPGADLSTWGLTGKGKLLIAAAGPLAGLKFITDVEIAEGKTKGIPFSGFILQANWQHNLLTVDTCRARLAGGELDISAKIRLAAERSLDIYEMNASWLKVNIAELKVKNFKGMFDGYMTVKGSWPEVEAQGRVMARKISYADYELGPLDTSFQYQQHKLSFSGIREKTKDKLRGSLEFKDKLIQANNLGVDFVKGGSFSVHGKIHTAQNNKMDLALTGRAVPVKEIASVCGLSNIYGTVDCTGKIQGSLSDPLTQFTVSSSELKAGNYPLSIACRGVMTKEKLELPEGSVNRNSTLWGNVKFAPNPYVDFNFQPQNLELGILLAAAGFDSGEKVKGFTNGQMNLSGLPGNMETRGNFKISGLELWNSPLGETQATLNFNQNKFFQGTLQSAAKEGKLRASWLVDLQKGKENKAEVVFNFDRFQSMWPGTSLAAPQINGRIKCAGRLKYNGQIKFAGDLSSENLTINGQPQVISGHTGYQEKELSVSLRLEPTFSFDAKVMMQDKPRIQGILKINVDSIAQANAVWQFKALERLSGAVRVEADISGLLVSPLIKGNLTLGRGVWRGLNFDQITGLWYCQDSNLYLTNLELKKGPEDYLVTGKIPFNEESPWWLNVQISQAELANLAAVVLSPQDAVPAGIKGRVQAELEVRGTRQHPLAAGNVLVHNFSYAGFPVSEISSDFSFKDEVITFNTCRAESQESKVFLEKGSTLTIPDAGKISFDGELGLRNIKFNHLVLFGNLAIKGEQEDCTATLKTLWVNQHQFTGEKIRMKWQDGKIEFLPLGNKETVITGKILNPADHEYVFDNIIFFERGKGVLNAGGKIKYPQTVNLYLSTQNQGVAVVTVSELLDLKTTVSGRALFNLDIQGRWANPEIDCSFSSFDGKIGGLDYDTCSGEFTVRDEVLALKNAELRGNKRYQLQAQGIIPLGEQGEYNLKVSLPDSSCEIFSLWPEFIRKAKGPLTAELAVTGKKDNPVLNGVFIIDRGELYPAKIVKKVSAVKIKVNIVNNKISIDTCSALIGDGALTLTGYMFLEKNIPADFDLTCRSDGKKGILVAIPGFIDRGEIKSETHVFGSAKNYQLAGEITLTNTHLTYPPKKSSAITAIADWLDYAHWNLAITGSDNTWYENELVEVNVKGKLAFTGTTSNLNVTGRVESVRGTLQYLGNDFRIKEAILEFYNNTAYLTGTAEAQVAQDTVVLNIAKNKLDNMQPHFTSRNDPQMTEQKVLGMLVYGPEINQLPGEEQNKVLVKEMLKMVDTTLNMRIIKPVVKKMGLDRVIDVVSIKTEVTQRAAEHTTGPVWKGSSVSIGKYLGPRIFLGYNTILAEGLTPNKLALKHQVEMDYQLKGSKYLKMRVDDKERFLGIENQIRF